MSNRVVILGGGESGIGAAVLAVQHGYEVFVSDKGSIDSDRKIELEQLSVAFEDGCHTDEAILNADLIIKSPGIPETAPLVVQAYNAGIEVISEVEFAYRHMKNCKIIAITGTNGKTTTSLLAYHLLVTAGYKVALGGNVGKSIAGLVAEGGYDYYVIEVSSFQLDGIKAFRPDIAILLNITPDHLDRYAYKFENYVQSKFKILENLTNEQSFIYCADSTPITEELSRSKVEACMFALSATQNENVSAYLENEHLIFNFQYKKNDKKYRIPLSEISLIGKHNIVNSMAAVLGALCLDVPIAKVLKGLKTFKNVAHRLEVLQEIDGVGYINDSKATNVDAVYYALDGVKKEIVWVAGGVDKGNDYDQIVDLVTEKVKAIVCLGTDNSAIQSYFSDKVQTIVEVSTALEAVQQAHRLAASGDAVLLSPACASFDLFDNYEDRGDQFKAAVLELSHHQNVKV